MTKTEYYKQILKRFEAYQECEFDERAGQLEFDGNAGTASAELRAFQELKTKYKLMEDEK